MRFGLVRVCCKQALNVSLSRCALRRGVVACSILAEEFAKREQLEELKESLEQLLEHEQMKSSELEQRRREQEQRLADEQHRLDTLEHERLMRDQQYQARILQRRCGSLLRVSHVAWYVRLCVGWEHR